MSHASLAPATGSSGGNETPAPVLRAGGEQRPAKRFAQPFRQVLMKAFRSSPLSSLLAASVLHEVILSC